MSSNLFNTTSYSYFDIPDRTLRKLLKTARNVKNNRKELHRKYILWDECTLETIEALKKIRDQLIKHSFNSKCAMLSGSSASIIGSIIGIVGVALAVPTAGISLILTATGTGLATTGGILSAGSAVTNHVLSKKLCKDAKEIFELNINHTENLERTRHDYCDALKDFENLLEQLEETDYHLLTTLTLENLEDSLKDLQLDEAVHRNLPPTVASMIEMKPNEKILFKNANVRKHLRQLSKLIREDPNMKILLSKYRSLKKDEPLLTTFPKANTGSGFTVVRGFAEMSKNFQFLIEEIGSTLRIAAGVLNGIFLILGVVDLVRISIQVHNGAETNQSKEIERIIRNLENYEKEVREIVKEIFGWNLK